jgi:hypothetical protein
VPGLVHKNCRQKNVSGQAENISFAISMPNLFESFFNGNQRVWDFPPDRLGRRWEIFSQERGHSAPKGF